MRSEYISVSPNEILKLEPKTWFDANLAGTRMEELKNEKSDV